MWYRIIFFLPVFFSVTLQGQDRAPKYSNEFLSIGVGARGMAMSRSMTAHTSDVMAAYWNPAGLASIANDFDVSLMHAEYFAGIAKYDYGAFAGRVDSLSHFAVSVIRFGVDDIPDTRFLYDANGAINYDRIQFFSAADYGFFLSYGRRIPQLNNLQLGTSVKVVHRKAGDFATAWGFGIDIGAQYKIKSWNLGVMLRDITTTFNAWSHNPDLVSDVYTQTGNEIPENSVEITLPKLILGGSRQFGFGDNFTLLASVDLLTTFDGKRNALIKTDVFSMDPSFGVEGGYKQTAFIRFGVGDFQQIKEFDGSTSGSFQPNFGVGVKLGNVSIDYALTDIGNQAESLYSHVFSISANFDKK